MRLVYHVRDAPDVGVALSPRTSDLVENAEELKGVLRTDDQVIVGIPAVVEMETNDHFMMEEPGHDLLDILGLIVVTRIHQK